MSPNGNNSLFIGQKRFDCNATWSDYKGKGCKYYESRKWCKKGGDHYGSKWPKERGTFELWWDGGKRKSDPYGIWPIAGTGANARVCPQCGCQEGQGVWISKYSTKYTLSSKATVTSKRCTV